MLYSWTIVDMKCGEVDDLKSNENVAKALRTSIMSKQYGHEDFLSELIANACSEYFYANTYYLFLKVDLKAGPCQCFLL